MDVERLIVEIISEELFPYVDVITEKELDILIKDALVNSNILKFSDTQEEETQQQETQETEEDFKIWDDPILLQGGIGIAESEDLKARVEKAEKEEKTRYVEETLSYYRNYVDRCKEMMKDIVGDQTSDEITEGAKELRGTLGSRILETIAVLEQKIPMLDWMINVAEKKQKTRGKKLKSPPGSPHAKTEEEVGQKFKSPGIMAVTPLQRERMERIKKLLESGMERALHLNKLINDRYLTHPERFFDGYVKREDGTIDYTGIKEDYWNYVENLCRTCVWVYMAFQPAGTSFITPKSKGQRNDIRLKDVIFFVDNFENMVKDLGFVKFTYYKSPEEEEITEEEKAQGVEEVVVEPLR